MSSWIDAPGGAASSVSDSDKILIDQGGVSRSVTRGRLLDGVQLKWQGDWSDQRGYRVNHSLRFLGSVYYVVVPTLAGESPTTNPEKYQLLSSKGDKGDAAESTLAAEAAAVAAASSQTGAATSATAAAASATAAATSATAAAGSQTGAANSAAAAGTSATGAANSAAAAASYTAVANAGGNAATLMGWQASQTPGPNQIPVLKSDGSLGGRVLVSSYASLTAAVAALGSINPIEIILDAPTTCTADTVVTSNIGIRGTIRGTINQGNHALTFNGPFEAGDFRVFTGTGNISGLAVVYPQWWGSVNGSGDATAGVQAAVGCIGRSATEGTMVVSGLFNITNNLWMASVGTSTVKAVFIGNGGFNLSVGKTLTLPAEIHAGQSQIFFGNIAGFTGLNIVRPEWTGAKKDSVTDDGPAINLAQLIGRTVIFTKGQGYYAASNITLKTGRKLIGDKHSRPVIQALASTTSLVTLDTGKIEDATIKDLDFRGYFLGATNPVVGQNCFDFIAQNVDGINSGLWDSTFERINIWGFTGDSIHIKGGDNNWKDPMQIISFNNVATARAAAAGHCLNIEGQVQHVTFDMCTFGGIYDVYTGTNVVINGVPAGGLVSLVDTIKFVNSDFEMGETAVSINHADGVVFDTCWFERLHYGITAGNLSRGVLAIGTRFANCAWQIGPAAGWAVAIDATSSATLIANVASGENGLGYYAYGNADNQIVSIGNVSDGTIGYFDASATIINAGSIKVAAPVYVNNAAAVAAGLVAGQTYRTGGDPDPLCIVH